MPAFIGVILAAGVLLANNAPALHNVAYWVQVFFWVRVAHAIVYTLGIPYLRTPVYLVSWMAILAIAAQFLIS